jgi:hypothetical protein
MPLHDCSPAVFFPRKQLRKSLLTFNVEANLHCIMASSPVPLNWYTLTLKGHFEQPNFRPVRAIACDLSDRGNIVAETWWSLNETRDVLSKIFEYPLLVDQHLYAVKKGARAQPLCGANGKDRICFERERLISVGFHAEDFKLFVTEAASRPRPRGF